ncbi:DUF3592 domain-containing protein [Streptomyces sp. ODS05-4]|uniref:DUF3592 domain-containing protein n=1 Tax=Streptomyces sp. ODS05-4 TaxID=2944939 RepID=UPI0021099272|nr:DUF3592 domain-containing protein [Streptomyces sp. ODS05-4]
MLRYAFPVLGLLALFWLIRRGIVLKRRGVEVEAHCYDCDWRGQGGPSFLLGYTVADGRRMTCRAGESHVPPGTRVGASVAVRYDPEEPSRVETALMANRPVWRQTDILVLSAVEMVFVIAALAG